MISVEKSMGMKAVAIAYIYPFILMLACLLIMIEFGLGELVSGLSALGITVVYYLAAYLLHGKIDREIVFKIRKA